MNLRPLRWKCKIVGLTEVGLVLHGFASLGARVGDHWHPRWGRFSGFRSSFGAHTML